MKRWLPWIVVGLGVLSVLQTLVPRREPDYHWRAFGALPVLLNGRLQPLDSVGRNALLQIRNKQSVVPRDGRPLSATAWLLEVLLKPEVADTRPAFRIDHPELLALLRLPPEEKHFSYQQLQSGLETIEQQAQHANSRESHQRTTFEKQVLKLHHALSLYHRLKNSLRPEDSPDFSRELEEFRQALGPGVAAFRAREAGQPFNQDDFNRLLRHLSRFNVMANTAYPLLVPPYTPEMARTEWQSVGTVLMESARREGQVPPPVTYYAAMATAYQQHQPDAFNQALREYRQWLGQHQPQALAKGQREYFFNQLKPFYQATVLYLVAFLLVSFYWLNLTDWLRRSAFYILVLAFIVHTVGLLFRMALEGRPPVTNLYSSAIFIGWGAVALGLFIERWFHQGIGIMVSAAIGFLTQIIAHNLALGGDTMEMLRAVLDTNFWLTTHVITITLGYSAAFFAGFLAIVFVLRGVLTRHLDRNLATSLSRAVYGIICFATLFSFIGTVLGGIWADQSWGRFWGWDPKENGALIIVLWNAAILHARWSGMIQERGLMNMAIFGNVVTSFSWFGVNMLGVGLHSYGFMEAAFLWLMAFNVSQLLLIGLGLLPPRRWASAASLQSSTG